MSYLSKIRCVPDTESPMDDPIVRRRRRLIERLREQQMMASALVERKPFTAYEAVWVQDAEIGDQIKRLAPKTVTPWYWQQGGVWYLR